MIFAYSEFFLRQRISKYEPLQVFIPLSRVLWLPGLADEIAEMQKNGRMIIMARVDEDIAFEVGANLGINMYQGFYIDKLVEHGDAQEDKST